MTITKEQRLERYRKSPEAIKELYASEDTQAITDRVIQMYKLEDKLEVVDVVGDIILGFYNKADLIPLLMQELGLSESIAQQIATDLSGLMNMIQNGVVTSIAPQPQAHAAPDLRPQTLQNAPTPLRTVSDTPQGTPPPLTREEVMQALTPRRTMAADIDTARKNNPNN